MRVRTMGRPRPALLPAPTPRPMLTFTAARLLPLPVAPPCFPSRHLDARLPLLPLASLPLPLAAQRTGEKRICSPVYLLMLPVCEKLVLFRWARGPSNSIDTSCGAVSCLIMLLLMAPQGLHFSAIMTMLFTGV